MKRLVLSHHAHLSLCVWLHCVSWTMNWPSSLWSFFTIITTMSRMTFPLSTLYQWWIALVILLYTKLTVKRAVRFFKCEWFELSLFPFSQCLLLGWSAQQWPGITLRHGTCESCPCGKETLSKSTARSAETRAGGKERPTDEWVNHGSLFISGWLNWSG